MKVDIASIIIAILSLSTFLVPIAWYQISQKKITKKLTNELLFLAKQDNLTLSEQEIWGDNCALGLDKKAKKLLYVRLEEQESQRDIIDLSEIEKCKVSNGTKHGITQTIRLQLYNQNSQKGLTNLEIYDQENGKSLTSEISIANRWAHAVNSVANNRAKTEYSLPLAV